VQRAGRHRSCPSATDDAQRAKDPCGCCDGAAPASRNRCHREETAGAPATSGRIEPRSSARLPTQWSSASPCTGDLAREEVMVAWRAPRLRAPHPVSLYLSDVDGEHRCRAAIDARDHLGQGPSTSRARPSPETSTTSAGRSFSGHSRTTWPCARGSGRVPLRARVPSARAGEVEDRDAMEPVRRCAAATRRRRLFCRARHTRWRSRVAPCARRPAAARPARA